MLFAINTFVRKLNLLLVLQIVVKSEDERISVAISPERSRRSCGCWGWWLSNVETQSDYTSISPNRIIEHEQPQYPIAERSDISTQDATYASHISKYNNSTTAIRTQQREI